MGYSNKVRRATDDDKWQYLSMVKKFYAEGKFPFALDMVRQSAIFDLAIDSDKHALWVVEGGKSLTGYLLAGHSTAPLSGEKVCQELMLWVSPEHRGSRAFLSLLRSFEAWGEELDVDRIGLSTQATMEPEKAGKIFERLGYPATETHYMKRRK